MVGDKKRILILGINSFPEITGIGRYTGEMLTWLAEKDYDVTVVTAFPYYPAWKIQAPYSGKWYLKEVLHGGKVVQYRCPLYVPANPTGIKRLMHEVSFFISAFLVVLSLLFKRKNHIIFSIAPPFHLGFLALFYRFFKGGKIIYHIQDLQVDAAKELKMLPEGLFSILFWLEKFIIRKVTFVSTISEGMIRKVRTKVNREILFFPNWVDTGTFFPLPARERLKLEWDFDEQDTVVLYSGSIGEKQGLEAIIEIAGRFQITHPSIKFIICGMGPYKERLTGLAEKAGLINLKFFPLQGNDVFNKFLNMADIHLVLQKGDASDLVMPSKLTTILAVGGLPLVTAKSGTTLYDVIVRHNLGVVIRPEDESELYEAIKQIAEGNFERVRQNARIYAEKYLNKQMILTSLIKRVFSTQKDISNSI